MSAEEISPVDQAGSNDQEREPHRRSGAVTFGLGVAALAGVVVTTGPVTPSAASASPVSRSAATAAPAEPAINQVSGYAIQTCTRPGEGSA